MKEQSTKGRVILIGAGPGDPDLITYKGIKHLQQAEIILCDRLVSHDIISKFANPTAEVICVGKNGNDSHHTTPQKKINDLLVEYALKGKYVIRLKGGDSSLFSNIYDELVTLITYEITYEIVPGVSAAFGAAAYLGVPLTARGFSRGVRLLTLCNLEDVTFTQWSEWDKTSDTLVFYMSGLKTKALLNGFLHINSRFDKPIAIVEQATTPMQKTTIFYQSQYQALKEYSFRDVPTIIIVGKVAELHEKFAWYVEKHLDNQPYFLNQKLI